jgi:anti-sigma regulatory factor (Ser/Thr protein kinase)/predicted transcriptional regulator
MKRKHSSEEIRNFIIKYVEKNPNSISRIVSEKFNISRQSVHRHLQTLIKEGLLKAEGNTRNRQYSLKPIIDELFTLSVSPQLEEDMVWRQKLKPLLKTIKSNVIDICHYGFTEMMNNVVDHSGSMSVAIGLTLLPNRIELHVSDQGVGIFKKISKELNLEDERHAVLELTKGKLTTDKAHHTGEGIFFTSRMFDRFSILSGSLYFSHTLGHEEDWLLQDEDKPFNGTGVTISISTNSPRTTKEVFDKYTATGEDYSFTRTHVPVALARYGEEQLISRSQAKRLLARLEPFKEVFLNFEGVDSIGQAFADEIFRVFKKEHPDIEIVWIRASKQIENMIKRVIAGSVSENQLEFKL